MYKDISFPLKLTLLRLLIAPLVMPFFIVYVLPINSIYGNCIVTVLFLLFGLTDFFDGYFARKYNQVTALGSTLDHLADKFLIYSVLIGLVAAHKIYFFWALIWIGREFFLMGLRCVALEHNITISVSSYGKTKTALQIICLAFVMYNPYQAFGFSHLWWNGTELLLLISATFLSVLSAYKYCYTFMKKNDSQLF